MKIALAIVGAFIGTFVGAVGMLLLCMYKVIPFHGCGISFFGWATGLALYVGAPLGLVTFSFIGFRIGRRIEENLKQQRTTQQQCDSGRHETTLPTDKPLRGDAGFLDRYLDYLDEQPFRPEGAIVAMLRKYRARSKPPTEDPTHEAPKSGTEGSR
jgi:hypothetical protein